MQLENSFEVAASRDTAWDLLMDVPRVVPCCPALSCRRPWTTRTGRQGLGQARANRAPVRRRRRPDRSRYGNDRVVLTTNAREVRGRGGAQGHDPVLADRAGGVSDARRRRTALAPDPSRSTGAASFRTSPARWWEVRRLSPEAARRSGGRGPGCGRTALQAGLRPEAGRRGGNTAVLGSACTWTIVFFLWMWHRPLAGRRSRRSRSSSPWSPPSGSSSSGHAAGQQA